MYVAWQSDRAKEKSFLTAELFILDLEKHISLFNRDFIVVKGIVYK